MRAVASFAPDPCDALPKNTDSGKQEATIFDGSVQAVISALNTGTVPDSPTLVAQRTLAIPAEQSTRENNSWPAANRFHAEVTALHDLLVLKLGFRSDERWFAIGYGTAYGQTYSTWSLVGEDQIPQTGRSSVAIYPIHSSPGAEPRFLASEFWTGCAGSSAIGYQIEEWQPRYQSLRSLLSQRGAQGMDPQSGAVTKDNPFPTVGRLKTGGRTIELPYCYFSPIDTWDNPSLCIADSYDVSGQELRFLSRKANRPDLLALANALTYATAHDRRALEAYCSTARLAARLLRATPGMEASIEVKPAGPNRERVETGSGHFTLGRRHGRWMVTAWTPA